MALSSPGLLDVVTTASISDATTQSPLSPIWVGTRGNTWKWCDSWFNTMPGSLFQLCCFLLFLAFMAGGRNVVAATYSHVLCTAAFLVFIAFGAIDVCSPDIIVWGVILMLINIFQIVYATIKSRSTEQVLTGDLNMLYNKQFSPFDISPEVFVEMVKTKGCQTMKLDKGQKYSAEGKTPVESLSMVISGKLTVSCNGNFLYSVTANNFIDSLEWESLRSSSRKSVFQVTITADSETKYISWKRKPLLSFLNKEKRLAKLMRFLIDRDIAEKLYSLNTRHFNSRGFYYDIRLSCVMSLRSDVIERSKKKKDVASNPNTPAGRRHKKLGKKASEHYSRLFARRMSERINMLRDRKDLQRLQVP